MQRCWAEETEPKVLNSSVCRNKRFNVMFAFMFHREYNVTQVWYNVTVSEL